MKYRIRVWPAIEATAKETIIECKTRGEALKVRDSIETVLVFQRMQVIDYYSHVVIVERFSSCGTWEEIN